MSEFYREYFTPGVYIDTQGYPYHPEFPRFLEDRPAPPRIPGQLELNVSTTQLPTLTKVVTGFTLAGALWGIEHWARPTLKASKIEERGGIWGWLHTFLYSAQDFLFHGTNYVGHEVSKGAAHSAHGPTHTLNAMAMRWEQLTWNVAFLTRQLELMFRRLRYHVIPREIRKQTTPIKAEQRRLKVGLATVTADENALRHWIHSQLNRHVYPRLGRVETKVNHTLPQRIRRGEKLNARQNVQIQTHTKLLVKLLPLLTIAGAVGLVLKAFTRLGLNFLRCQNVKDFGNTLCPSPPGAGRGLGRFGGRFGSLLGELAALSFVPFLLTEACQIVGLVEAAAIKVQPEIDALVLSIEGFVCGGPSYLPSAIEPSDLARGAPLPSGL